MCKPLLDAIVVVEGKTDTIKLKSIFDVETIETNGSALNLLTLNLIQKAVLKKRVIILTDPDYQGKNISHKIKQQIPQVEICHIPFKHQNKKNGIAELPTNLLKEKLNYLISLNINKKSITWSEYLDLNLNNKIKRLYISNKLNIPYFNHKKLYKVLCYLKYDYEQIKLL